VSIADTSAGGSSDSDVRAAVTAAYRSEWAFVLAATARTVGDLDLAEECTAEAFSIALVSWARDGIPRSPGAWLTTTARRRAIDQLRRERTLRQKLPLLIDPQTGTSYDAQGPQPLDELMGEEGEVIADDRLRLVFTCCHPALAREAQVALTLRLVCGLSTADIAAAFLVSEPTMAARVTRAKKKIAGARIPYRVPGGAELPERLDAVLTVVHLLFTTGHTDPAGADLVRGDLVERALALGRMLVSLMPDEREAVGLLALMMLTDARRNSRVDGAGRLVLLEDQDRSAWDRDEVAQGQELVLQALRGGRPGRFALQAAIAGLHGEAASWDQTDWPQIVVFYDLLLRVWPSPVVALNRAVAVAMVDGPQAGLDALAEVERDGRLATYRYLPATKADLLRRLGRYDEAASAYRAAIDLVGNQAERDFLTARLASVQGDAGPRSR
jgi:RNA polymerase sigma-70 factor (ECF subfamily)